MCREMKTANIPVGIGEYLGMKMAATFDSFSRKFTLALKGNLSHTIEVVKPFAQEAELAEKLDRLAELK